MRLIADLHIHSRFSRATSKKLTPSSLDRWARIKGINLLGTGDCTHPRWLKELRDQLEDGEPGFYRLKPSLREEFDRDEALVLGLPKPKDSGENFRFVLTAEISTIYKRGERTRKVHHLVILPDFKAAGAFQTRLERVGNISSDGRPILGIDSRDLLAILMDVDDRALLIPAHIWTPWFSALGAKSGFDSLEECYGDGASLIPAIETGLSSNPPMNWALNSLAPYAIISNSDAHSPDKLGREATVFSMDPSYRSLVAALWSVRGAQLPAGEDPGASAAPVPGNPSVPGNPLVPGNLSVPGILETIEFFPQEGKYHYQGHRKCGVYLSPEDAAKSGGRCPRCGKPLTEGVMGRVMELARGPVDETAPCLPEPGQLNRRPYRSLIPLRELLGDLLEVGPASKRVDSLYGMFIEQAGSELSILMDMSLEAIKDLTGSSLSGKDLAGAIGAMRSGNVSVVPGYDGEYGIIRVNRKPRTEPGGEPPKAPGRGELFPALPSPGPVSAPKTAAPKTASAPKTPSPEERREPGSPGPGPAAAGVPDGDPGREPGFHLNEEQEAAIRYDGKQAIIIAGPGTGKTAALTARIFRLLDQGRDPASILALTFTVKAAAELRERVLGNPGFSGAGPFPAITAVTFHALCAALLREYPAMVPERFQILSEAEREALLEEICASGSGKKLSPQRLGTYIEGRKRFLLLPGETEPKLPPDLKDSFGIPHSFGISDSPGTPQSFGFSDSPGTPESALFNPPPVEAELEDRYRIYRRRLRAANLVDYDDLPLGTVRLLGGKGDVLAEIRRRYRHILVDEYQDVNFAQYALIRLLAPASGEDSPELRVIGDPNQAIYGFRGSDKRFLERFFQDYPGAERFYLARSFRCAAPLIDAANRLASTTLTGSPRAVTLYRNGYPTEKSEAEGIARRISALIGGTSFFALDSRVAGNQEAGNREAGDPEVPEAGDQLSGLGDCAILLRTFALAPPLLQALEDHGIPFSYEGEKPWWEREPVQSLIALLRETGDRAAPAGEAARSAWDALRGQGQFPVPGEAETGLLARLLSLAAWYDNLGELLDTLAVSGAGDDPRGKVTPEGVRIMSIHASKGLEFDQVFIPALEEGLLPFTLYEGEIPERIEEERRLLYVAMTRAKRGLSLSWVRARNLGGRILKARESRFLSGLEDLFSLGEERRPRNRDVQLRLF